MFTRYLKDPWMHEFQILECNITDFFSLAYFPW